MNPQELIDALDLRPLEFEGGYYRETYRSDASTAIYYLLTIETFSAMHRISGDEVFHFYAGDPVEMLQLHPDGGHSLVIIGNNIQAGQQPQVVVTAGTWQGCRVMAGGGWALLGTTVAPPFDPADFELGDRDALVSAYPDCADAISRLVHSV